MATIRSFVAIELSDAARQALAARQRDLKAAIPPQTVRWTIPDSIHLTLQFLGDVPLEKIPAITSALRDACAGTAPFAFELIGLGVFPDRRRPRIVWVGVREPSGTLAALHGRVGQALAALGFPPEERAFTPHLTIGRAARDAAPRDLAAAGEHVARLDVGLIARIPVGHIALMKSDLRPTGALYTAQATFPLGVK
jgi:RNA 2',3'-cyclic 3'-phosphodiesterase